MNQSMIKKVHVVFKTHLDIGFTDLGQTVLDRYVHEYIPHSVDLAFELNTEQDKRFIWTVGTYLIDYYFEHGDADGVERLKKAIRRGDICWHGMACTTHTELLDEDLFAFSLDISDRLDKQFGKKTIAAKMTDVPGHTRAMVGMLSEHGKRYLHIGVNASSMVPDVPMTFVWQVDQAEILVQYSAEYGAPCYVEGMDEVLEFAHTGDNLGPQSAEAIEAEMERIQKIYPHAVVVASTMDAYAEKLLEYREMLPVVSEEIGDTWIHGIASDPLKVMRYRALIELKNRWKQEGRFDCWAEDSYEFMMNLLLVAEHTWGLDYKKYLADFTNWEKADFQEARKQDVTTLEFLTNRNAHMLNVLEEDFKRYRGGKFTGSYKHFERSHEEQMEYIRKAVDGLAAGLREEALEELERLDRCSRDVDEGNDAGIDAEDASVSVYPYEHLHIGCFEVCFGGHGELAYLAKDGVEWITEGHFGRLVYSTYSAVDCVHNYYSYNRAFRETQCWSEGDFSKPGVEFVEDLQHKEYFFGAKKIERKQNEVTIRLEGDRKAVETYGCPAHAVIRYVFGDEVRCSLSWNGKDANRMPEALWFDWKFDVENPYRWQMNKMGHMVSPLDVVKGGNRRQHGVEEMRYHGADGRLSVKNIHSPLISIGGRWLYGDYRLIPDVKDGFAYCLFNNKWGTNFKMWCEDDCTFEYLVRLG